MLHEELQSIRSALGGVLGRLDPDGADLVRQCCRNLDAAADQAKELEGRLIPDSAVRLVDRPPLSGELDAEECA